MSAIPNPVRRFAYYLHCVLEDRAIDARRLQKEFDAANAFGIEAPVSPWVFYNDMDHLNTLLPRLLNQGGRVQNVAPHLYRYVPEGKKSTEGETFLPFLAKALEDRSLFPFDSEHWLRTWLQDRRQAGQEDLEARIHYRHQPRPKRLKSEIMLTLATSFLERRLLVMDYRNAGEQRRQLRVEPLLLLNMGGSWYLLGEATYPEFGRVDQPVQFKLSRILQLRLSDEPFRGAYSLKELERNYLQVYGSFLGNRNFPEGVREVSLVFSAEAATFAEESVFHPGQAPLEVLTPGDAQTPRQVRVRLRVRYYDEAVRLALSWPVLVRPEAPADFVEAFKTAVRDLARFSKTLG